jgi:hypothetical protein
MTLYQDYGGNVLCGDSRSHASVQVLPSGSNKGTSSRKPLLDFVPVFSPSTSSLIPFTTPIYSYVLSLKWSTIAIFFCNSR